MLIWQASLLGLIEGLTEFIPVSSTGHLLLTGHFLGFNSPGKTFEVLIQLGAVLAILSIYSAKLLNVALAAPHNPQNRQFILAVVVAFLPAAIIGALLHGFIKSVLFETPWLICTTLITGGIILLVVDRMKLTPRHTNAMNIPITTALGIGLCQCLAMIPGVSRSGSSIVGALLLGVNKRAATEFSFFLAIPTMAGAFTYDLYKNWSILNVSDTMAIIVGFLIAFAAGVVVVKYLLDFVSRHGFTPFAWWRIAVGTAGLIGLALVG